MPLKKGCALTVLAPPEMFPRRLLVSETQSLEIRSRALGERECGYRIRASTILGGHSMLAHDFVRQRTNVLLVDLHRILVPKWRLPDQELIHQNPKCPPVHSAPVPSVSYDFRSKIFRGSAKCVCLPCCLISIVSYAWTYVNLLSQIFFAKPKSTNFRWPSASIRIFSGFRSRYATPSFSCRNSRISTISAA